MIREEQYFHYIVSSRLGVGSFGEVCKVKRLTDGKSFALKTLKDGIVKRNPRILQMLNHEVSGLLGKYHPNMVTMYDAFTIKGDFFLIYELCEPQSLKTRLKQGAVWDEHNVVELAKGMVKVLHYLHGLGILHRDIKPDNILVKDDEYKLADFGLCYRGGSHYDNDLIGSPAYLAPEIFKKRYYSDKSDIYALGISLYELYIGKYPFDQKNEAALYKRKMEFVPSRDNMPTASDKFIVLLRMMCHPVENKRATIDELVTALDIRFDAVNAAMQNHVSEFGETPQQQVGHFDPSQYNHQAGQGTQQQPHSAYDHAAYQDTNQLQQPVAHIDQYAAPVASMQNNNFVQQDFGVMHAPAPQDKLKVGYYDPWAITPTTSAPTSNTGSFSNEIPANGFAPQSNYNNMFDEHMMRRVPYKNQPFVASPDGIRGQQRSEHRQDLAHGASPHLLAAEDYSQGFLAQNKRGRDYAHDENTKPASGLSIDLYAREPAHQMHRAYTLEERGHKTHERSQSSHPQQKRFISSNRMNADALIQREVPSQQNHQNYGVHRPAFEPIAMNHRRDLLAIPGIGMQDIRSGSRPRLMTETTEDQSPNSAKKFSRYLRANEELSQPTSSNNRADLPFLPQTRTVTAQPHSGHFQFPESAAPQPAVQRSSNFVGSFRTVVPSPHQQGSFQLTDQTSPSPMISPIRNSPTYATPVGGHPQFFQQKILQLQPVPAPSATDNRYVNAEAQNILNEINTFTEHIQPQRQRARQIFDEYHQGQPQGSRRYN